MLDISATTFWENFDLEWMNIAGRFDKIPGQQSGSPNMFWILK